MAESRSPLINTATTLGKVVAFFAAAALAGVLTAGTLVPLAVGTSAATNVAQESWDAIPSIGKNAPVAVPSVMQDRDGKTIAKFFSQNRKPVKLKDISKTMQKAIVSVEDERFYEHGGADPRGILRAVMSNVTGSGRQGASTITQQYVNNLNINNQIAAGVPADQLTISGNKDVLDKVREVKWANEVEKKMSKDQILEGYLNLVLFSGTTYGIEAASQKFFSIPAKDLNVQQSAMLAGMVQRPVRFNPLVNPDETLKRRNVVLGQMLKTGAISQKQYDKAVKTKLGLKTSNQPSGCQTAGDDAYFCSYVVNQFLNDPTYGKTAKDREALLYRGGLTIKTTLDPRLQKQAVKQVAQTVPVGDPGGLGSAIVSRDSTTGDILAMAQNTKFGTKKNNEAYTEVNFATRSFQGGSTAKPWTAVAWLEAGHSMGDMVNASRDNYSNTKWKASCEPGGDAYVADWNPGNASPGMKNRMPASAGLFWSINTATIAEAYQLDLCKIAKVASRMTLIPEDSVKDVAANPSFVIGSVGVTPLAQARGFSSFGNKGTLCLDHPISSVKSQAGENYDVAESKCDQAFEPDIISKLNGTLTHLASERVVKGKFSASVGGKTGTNNNATSTWFAGYTSNITTVAWVGRKDGKTSRPGLNNGVYLRGIPQRKADSMTLAGPLWSRYMASVYQYYPHDTIPRSGPFSKNYRGSGANTAKSASDVTPDQGTEGDAPVASPVADAAAALSPAASDSPAGGDTSGKQPAATAPKDDRSSGKGRHSRGSRGKKGHD